MRTLLFALGLLLALPLSGCDTVGIDGPSCTTCDDDDDEPGGQTKRTVRVDPHQTYLFADEEDQVPQPVDAPAVPLSHLGLEPGDHACFKAQGDFYYYEDFSARERGGPLVTAVFSDSDDLGDVSERRRVRGALDAGDDVQTETTWLGDAPTDIAEDFDATDACVTVPDGAGYLFFSPADRLFRDNVDAMVDGKPFRVDVTH